MCVRVCLHQKTDHKPPRRTFSAPAARGGHGTANNSNKGRLSGPSSSILRRGREPHTADGMCHPAPSAAVVERRAGTKAAHGFFTRTSWCPCPSAPASGCARTSPVPVPRYAPTRPLLVRYSPATRPLLVAALCSYSFATCVRHVPVPFGARACAVPLPLRTRSLPFYPPPWLCAGVQQALLVVVVVAWCASYHQCVKNARLSSLHLELSPRLPACPPGGTCPPALLRVCVLVLCVCPVLRSSGDIHKNKHNTCTLIKNLMSFTSRPPPPPLPRPALLHPPPPRPPPRRLRRWRRRPARARVQDDEGVLNWRSQQGIRGQPSRGPPRRVWITARGARLRHTFTVAHEGGEGAPPRRRQQQRECEQRVQQQRARRRARRRHRHRQQLLEREREQREQQQRERRRRRRQQQREREREQREQQQRERRRRPPPPPPLAPRRSTGRPCPPPSRADRTRAALTASRSWWPGRSEGHSRECRDPASG